MSKQSYPNILSLGMGDYVGIEADNGDNKLIINRSNGIKTVNCGTYLQSKIVKITSAQLKTLNATPVTVIDAPGDGYFIAINGWSARHDAGTAYSGIASNEDLALKYVDASGSIASGVMEIIGFLDQSTAQIRCVEGSTDLVSLTPTVTPVNNGAIVLHMLSGEITTGTFDLYLFINYYVIPSDYVV